MFEVKDYYFFKAKKDSYLARSVYKLEEIDAKYKIFKKGAMVLDLGYYPGSWTQYSSEKIGKDGQVVAVDIQEVHPAIEKIENVKVFQKDINSLRNLSDIEVSSPFQLILSDMAPRTTGIKMVDQFKSLELVESVFGLIDTFLLPGGSLVVKVFECQKSREFLKGQKARFQEMAFLRPKSTRKQSVEFFVIARNFKA